MSKGLLAPLAPHHPRILKKLDHAFNTGGLTISWLEALKNQGTEATQETEIATDAASSSATELSESLTQQGAKSAKSPSTPRLEGMETVLNGTDEVDVSVEVEARIARSWGDEGER